MRWILRSKIHKANVTHADPGYVGSITIDENLIDKVGLWPGEKVLVVDNTNGERLETYVIVGKRGSGIIGMNGAAALRINIGDEIIIMGFELSDQAIKPKNILVNRKNGFDKYL
ncbi:aspartate 1-decarboxylase [Patescibacteria group bacterium]|nr:aspartate 1-decarboxylase [Patescibacteria group bacterium]